MDKKNIFIVRHKQNLIYGLSMAALLFLLKWIELRYIIIDHAFQIYTGLIAIVFTALGIWLALNINPLKAERQILKKEEGDSDNAAVPAIAGTANNPALSKRELEVLKLMALGLSNDEIATSLFISLNTVKTHSSRLFEKMDVKRRTQAIDLGKKMGIIP